MCVSGGRLFSIGAAAPRDFPSPCSIRQIATRFLDSWSFMIDPSFLLSWHLSLCPPCVLP